MATGRVVMRKHTIIQIAIIVVIVITMVGFKGASASALKYGGSGSHHSRSSGGQKTPPSGCGNNCPAPLPNPPSCSFVSSSSAGSSPMPSGAPGTLYFEQCSPACVQAGVGGKVGCSTPSAPCAVPPGVSVGVAFSGGSTTAVDCPVGGTTTSWTSQYGYSASPGNVCVSKWVVTYVGQVYKTVPTGCSASLSMPANYFRQSCQGANTPTTATVQYWLQLPLISPPTSPPPGWAVAGWPPSTSTSGGGGVLSRWVGGAPRAIHADGYGATMPCLSGYKIR